MTTPIPADSPLSPENAQSTARAVQAAMTQQGAPKDQVAFAGNLLRDDDMRAQIATMEAHRQREQASFLEWLVELIKAIFGLVVAAAETVASVFTSKDNPPMPPAGFMEKNRSGLERMAGGQGFDRPPRKRDRFDKDDNFAREEKSDSRKEFKGRGEATQDSQEKPAPKKRKGFAAAPAPVDDGMDAGVQPSYEEIGEDGLTDVQRMFVHHGDMSYSEAIADNQARTLPADLDPDQPPFDLGADQPPPELEEGQPPSARHRGQDDDRLTGALLDHGHANYKFDREEGLSYYVKIRQASGREYTQWGTELASAMILADCEKGDRIKMINLGKQPVEVTKRVKENGQTVIKKEPGYRNGWQVDVLEKAAPEATSDAPPEGQVVSRMFRVK